MYDAALPTPTLEFRNAERRTALPTQLPPVRVRVLRSAFFVDGRVPEIGEIVELEPDVAESLEFTGKVERKA